MDFSGPNLLVFAVTLVVAAVVAAIASFAMIAKRGGPEPIPSWTITVPASLALLYVVLVVGGVFVFAATEAMQTAFTSAGLLGAMLLGFCASGNALMRAQGS